MLRVAGGFILRRLGLRLLLQCSLQQITNICILFAKFYVRRDNSVKYWLAPLGAQGSVLLLIAVLSIGLLYLLLPLIDPHLEAQHLRFSERQLL